MRFGAYGFRAFALTAGFVVLSPLFSSEASAARTNPGASGKSPAAHTSSIHTASAREGSVHNATYHTAIKGEHLPIVHTIAHESKIGPKHSLLKGGKASYYSRGGGMQCVPFARAASGIELKGNAANWWDAANGVYARGQAPEAGSVLNFRATGSMRLGHVAVVTHVVSSREIEIDHANWAGPGASKGGVSRAIPVVDVSENNDWSAVRVGLGHSGSYGSVYPTYGFIYDRPDNGGGMLANLRRAPAVSIPYDEVAEAPSRSIR